MEYKKQAEKFLKDFELNLSVRNAIPEKAPLWASEGEDYGKCYWFTLSNKDGKHFSSHFWGSIADKKESKGVSHYDILACLNTFSAGQTFSEFCASYGYDIDSMKAHKIYEAVMKENDGLKAILSDKAIEALNNIN